MVKKAKTPKWYPVLPIKPKDNLVSSDYADHPPFIPSYSKEKENMFLLMAHDYAKLWKLETKAVERKRFEFAGEEHERLCRRYVLRAVQKKKKVAETKPRFIMKRFQNIPSKVRQYMCSREAARSKEEFEGRNYDDLKPKDEVALRKPSKIVNARDSRDLMHKQNNSKNSDYEACCCDTAEVDICPDLMPCDSQVDVVSPSPAVTNLVDYPCSIKSRESGKSERPHNHFHVAFDGSDVYVREMPPVHHEHPLKVNALPV